MREILFRGKRVDNGEWVYGSLIYVTDGNTLKRYPNIVISYNHDTFDWHEVIPESVCQFTGLLDKNGNKIYEGDKFQGDEPGEFYIINWNNEEAIFQMDLYGYSVSAGEGSQEVYDNEISQIDSNFFELSALSSDEIIGNIHEDSDK